mgnify:CR=1 FL=1
MRGSALGDERKNRQWGRYTPSPMATAPLAQWSRMNMTLYNYQGSGYALKS